MTNYKVIYELSNRVKTVIIPAYTPLEAFRKFKEMMPSIIYKNLSLHDIEEQIIKSKPETIKEIKCHDCNPFKIQRAS